MKLVIRLSVSRRALVLIGLILVIVIGSFIVSYHNRPKPLPPHTTQNGNFNAGLRSAEISISSALFTPSKVTVVKGTTVTWTNNDKASHNVTMDQGDGPHSGNIPPGGSFAYTFNQSGSFKYHCGIHPSMQGTVIVQ